MLYREIIAVCSQIFTKHINTLCRQNVKLLNVKLAVHMVTTGLQRVTIAKHNSIAMQFLVSRAYKMTQQQQCNGHTQDAPELGSVHPV